MNNNIFEYDGKRDYSNIDIIQYQDNMCFVDEYNTYTIASIDDVLYLIIGTKFNSEIYEISVSDDRVEIKPEKLMIAVFDKFEHSVTCQLPVNGMYHINTFIDKFKVIDAHKIFSDNIDIRPSTRYLHALAMSMGFYVSAFVITENSEEFKRILFRHKDNYSSYLPTATPCYSSVEIMEMCSNLSDSIYRLTNNTNSIGYIAQGIGLMNVYCNILMNDEGVDVFNSDITEIYNELYRALGKFVPKEFYMKTLEELPNYLPHYIRYDLCKCVTRYSK